MTSRERWTIYPLLFLALGAALRDKLAMEVEVDGKLTCRELQIVDPDGQPLIVLKPELGTAVMIGGEPRQYATISTYADDGTRLSQWGPQSTCKRILVTDMQGKPLVAIGPENFLRGGKPDYSGAIQTIGSNGKPLAQLGPVLLCHEVHVVSKDGRRRLASLGSVNVNTKEGAKRTVGHMTIQGTNGRPVVSLGSDETGQTGLISTQSIDGRPQVVLKSNETGGMIATLDQQKQLAIVLGHLGAISGLFVEDAQNRLIPMAKPIIQKQETEQPEEMSEPKPPEPKEK